jgi:hypothetical protein
MELELDRESRGEINVACKEIQLLAIFISACCKLNQAIDEIPGSVEGIEEAIERIRHHMVSKDIKKDGE